MTLNRLSALTLLLPVLGVFDLCSTLYVHLLGYSLEKYEAGLFASFFAKAGLFYLYVPIYFVILFTVSFGLYRVANDLKPSLPLDKLILLLVAGAICFIYARLTGVILSNFLFNVKSVSRISVMWVGYVTATISIVLFVYDELLGFLTFSSEETV
ncbi:MAG: hypothetical protein U9O89_05685 [Thermoproteota archaeon]|nr:hypothetical protein [Thermoproteota archaeon]